MHTYLHEPAGSSPDSRAEERCHLPAAEGWWELAGSSAPGKKSRSLGWGVWSSSDLHRDVWGPLWGRKIWRCPLLWQVYYPLLCLQAMEGKIMSECPACRKNFLLLHWEVSNKTCSSGQQLAWGKLAVEKPWPSSAPGRVLLMSKSAQR